MTEHESGPGFAERERRTRAAWEQFSSAPVMSHEFRAGYHRAVIDAATRQENT